MNEESLPSRERLLNIGLGNYLLAKRIVCIVNPMSQPMRRMREEAKNDHRLVDTTQGRKTRSIIVMDSNHVILSAIQAETLLKRLGQEEFDVPAQ